MANGFFLGGLAEGAKTAEDIIAKKEELALGREKLSADIGLKTRGLDLEERQLGQNLSLRTRELGIQEQANKNSMIRELWSRADKQITDTMKVIDETITAGMEAGRDPAVIAKTVQPFLASAKKIAAATGVDPTRLDIQVQTLMARPSSAEAAVGKAKSGVAAAETVVKETGVTRREALQGQGVLKAEPRGDSTLEGIRSKIAGGSELTPGEQRVYQDSLKSEGDTIVQLLKGLGVIQPQAAETTTSVPATPLVPSPSTQPVPPAFKDDPDGSEYRKGNAVWVKQGDKLVLKK